VRTPRWLDARALVLLHAETLAEHGGLTGIRDAGAFDSALARPRNIFHYEQKSDLPQLAAAYAYGLIQNHPFNDGNKRLGFIAAALFLELNGLELRCDQTEAIHMMFSVAAGKTNETDLARWLRANSAKPR
jgi:death on curing protein